MARIDLVEWFSQGNVKKFWRKLMQTGAKSFEMALRGEGGMLERGRAAPSI
jgi:hypothetical protein